jgi:hypothetical protein
MARIRWFVLCFAGIVAVISAPALPAQENETPPNQKRVDEDEGPAFFAKPNPQFGQKLKTAADKAKGSVLIVGFPKAGHGTAWVLSSQHRLLATNAHVADLLATKGKMLAIVNGTEQVHKVESVLYHPGVRRKMPGGQTSIRAPCPQDGDIDPRCPDVAVIQLTADGPALPPELPMATPDELKNLFAQTVGMLGFPGHDSSWPQAGDTPSCTYCDGVVSRLSNFFFSRAHEDEQQFVQHTLPSWGGYSGSPIFLANGHVVALHNMSRFANKEFSGNTALVKAIPHGVRIDCLWELLVHHQLEAKVPIPIDKSKLRLKRWLEPDEAEKKYRQACKLVEEAERLIDQDQRFTDGIRKCDEAIALLPNYPDAYRVRCAARNSIYAYENPAGEGKQLLGLALDDAAKFAKLMPTDPRWLVAEINTAINISKLGRNRAVLGPYMGKLDKALEAEGLPKPLRAEFFSLRGLCHFIRGNDDAAFNDLNNSVRLDPDNDVLYDNRARCWEALRRYELAERDRAKARQIRKDLLSAPKVIKGSKGPADP